MEEIQVSPRWSWWRRALANFSAFLVGLVAAILSWRHIVHTAKVYGHEPDWASWLYPVPIDGMMIVGVVMAADDRATGRKVRPMARVATAVGGVLSVAAQMASAYVYGPMAIAVAIVPSGALIITVEVMAKRGKRLEEARARAVAEAEESSPAPVPEVTETPIVAPEPTNPQAEPQAPEEVPEEEQTAPSRPVPTAKRRRARTGWSYPTPVEVIEATIVPAEESRAVVPAFIGPPMADSDADMG